MHSFTLAQFAAMKFLVAQMAADCQGHQFDPVDVGWNWLPTEDQMCATVDGADVWCGDIVLAAYELLRSLVDAHADLLGCPKEAVVADLALTLALCEG